MTVYNNEVYFESVSAVTATPSVEVGRRRSEGDERYIYVYNAGNSQISPGYAAIVSAVSGYSVTVSSVTSVDVPVGFCKHATLTTGTYGWLVTHGFCQGVMAANHSAAVGSPLVLAADGALAQKSISTGYPAAAMAKAMEAISSGVSGSIFVFCS